MSGIVDLKRLYRERRIIPFVGAGASMAVAWGKDETKKSGPSWSELVDQAARDLGATDPDLMRVRGTDLQILEYFGISNAGFAKLTNWLSIEFSRATDENIMASPIHAELAQLEKCRMIYTTNYDNFIERALQKSGKKVHIVSSEHSISHDMDATQVIKFHGDFNSPESMVLSESHYMERMRLESAMDFKLRGDLLGRAVLFIGYSFRDPNVNYIFHVVNRLFSNLPGSYSGRRAYIILPEPSEFERRLFHARNIEVIPVSSKNLAEGVGGVLNSMRG